MKVAPVLVSLICIAMLALAAGEKPIVLTAEQLTKECAADRDAANKKYEDKVLIVTGTVFKSEKLAADETWSVALEGFTAEGEIRAKLVDFQFDPKSPFYAEAKKLEKGQKVKLKGTYLIAFPYGPRLNKSEVVKEK